MTKRGRFFYIDLFLFLATIFNKMPILLILSVFRFKQHIQKNCFLFRDAAPRGTRVIMK